MYLFLRFSFGTAIMFLHFILSRKAAQIQAVKKQTRPVLGGAANDTVRNVNIGKESIYSFL